MTGYGNILFESYCMQQKELTVRALERLGDLLS